MSSPSLTVAKFCLPADIYRILEQIDHLRASATLDEPLAWEQVGKEVLLFATPKQTKGRAKPQKETAAQQKRRLAPLRPYVWLLAAILRCQNHTWDQVADHPWVDGMLTAVTLRTNAAKAKLPGGSKFEDFITEYREARESETRKLAQEQAAEDARRSRNVFQDSLELSHSHIRAVLWHEKAQGRLKLVDLDGDPLPLAEEELDEMLKAAKINKDATGTAHSAYQGLRLINNQATEILGDDDGTPGAEFAGGLDAELARLEAEEAALDAELATLSGVA